MKKLLFFSFMLSLCIYASSCTGKEGAIGPAGANGTNGTTGPAGPTGAAGATGSQGQMGLTGATGNANVKTRIFNALPASWLLSTSTTVSSYYESTAMLPEITQAIHDRGLVLAFMSEDNTQAVWLGMPALQVVKTTTPYITTFKYKSKVGSVIFTAQDSDGLSPALPSARFFKVVIIEGTGALPSGVDPTNYKQVAKYLGLDTL